MACVRAGFRVTSLSMTAAALPNVAAAVAGPPMPSWWTPQQSRSPLIRREQARREVFGPLAHLAELGL